MMGSVSLPAGNLSRTSAPLKIGSFPGAVEQFVLLGRGLTEEEKAILTEPPESFFSSATLSAVVPAGVPVPTSMRFAFTDFNFSTQAPALKSAQALKRLFVNGQEVWSQRGQDLMTEFYNVSLSRALSSSVGPATVTFELVNGRQSGILLRLYFSDKFWREQTWTAGGSRLGSNWNYSFIPDPLEDLGPMSEYLDDAVISPSYVTKSTQDWVRSLGMKASYYTTYMADAPVPIWNRVLSGVVPSTLNAPTLTVYAYGDWAADPWDEQSGRRVDGGMGAMPAFEASYAMVQPTWDEMLLDSVAWETLREGVEDSRVIRLLKNAIAEHPETPSALQAANLLRDHLSRVSLDYAPRYFTTRAADPIEKHANPTDLLLLDICGNETDFACLDRIRVQMIRLVQAIAVESSAGLSSSSVSSSRKQTVVDASCRETISFLVCSLASLVALSL